MRPWAFRGPSVSSCWKRLAAARVPVGTGAGESVPQRQPRALAHGPSATWPRCSWSLQLQSPEPPWHSASPCMASLPKLQRRCAYHCPSCWHLQWCHNKARSGQLVHHARGHLTLAVSLESESNTVIKFRSCIIEGRVSNRRRCSSIP